jgi:hypothetical protein
MVMLLDTAFFGYNPDESAFFTGGVTTSLVPDTFMVSLNGRPYMIDMNQPFYRQYKRQLAQLLRTQADTSKDPGETSLDPDALWRRSFDDWSLGAGQRYLDRDTSLANRFWASKGIDCLTSRWQISLLPDTSNVYSSAGTNLSMTQAASGGVTYLYVIDGQTLKFSSNGTSWTTVTGTPAVTASSICSDGYDVWVAYGASGVYTTTAGAASATQYVTSGVDAAAAVGYVNGRLMVGSTNKLYNVVATGALPAALFTAGNPNFKFTNFADGQSYLYAAGTAGTQSYIYGVSVTSDGTTLGAPVVQGMLPAGETVTAVCGYLGYLVIGTTQGVRFATAASSGIVLQSLIPTPGAVQCAVGWGRFVYFGWSNYDGVSTGLGRMDLANFAVPGVQPAYASDLMATAQGAVTSVVMFGGKPYFAVAGQGVFTQSANLVASGTVQSGYILYDLADTKVACLLDCQTAGPLTFGSYTAALSVDAGAFSTVGSHTVGQTEPVTFSAGNQSGQRFEVQLTLSRDGVTSTAGPTFTRFTLRSFPAPRRPLTWQLPLILDEKQTTRSGMDEGFDPLVELQALETMATAGQLVTYQEGRLQFQVFVEDVVFLPDYMTEDHHFFNGVALVSLKGLPPTTS